MIHRSTTPDVTIPAVPLTSVVLDKAARQRDKAALIDGSTGRTVTYAELADLVRRFAGGLLRNGARRGDVVGLIAPNSIEFAVVFLGTAHAGCTVTTMNPLATAHDLNFQLRNSKATRLFVTEALLPLATEASAGTGVQLIVVLDGAATTSLESFLADPLMDPVAVDPDSIVALPYSSGTTGFPKGVMLSHRNLVANIVQTLSLSDYDDTTVLDGVLPFFHIYGMQVTLNGALAAGVTTVFLPRFDLESFLAMHQTYRITHSFVAPPIVLAMAKHPLIDQYDLSALRRVLSGAAPLSAELAHLAATRLGVEVVQGYGMTEMSPVSHMTPIGEFRPGTVGPVLPNTEMQIIDPMTSAPLGVGEEGEVWIRGPQVMAGYLGNQTATDETLTPDGWLRTGDLGRVDEFGHLTISDRLKELIKYKGFQVAPAELEALLLTHADVVDAAVLGRPDDIAGEVPIAFVVLRDPSTADVEAIRASINDQVARYKRIAQVVPVSEIPKSAAGKVLRRLLRDQLVARPVSAGQ